MTLNSHEFLSSRRASFLQNRELSESKQMIPENDNPLSLDDLHPTSSSMEGEPSISDQQFTGSINLTPPQTDDPIDPCENLPTLAGDNMFSLSRVQSAMGMINLKLDGVAPPPNVMALWENTRGEQRMVPRDSFYHSGILHGLGGEITLDLSHVTEWRRLALLMVCPFEGVLSMSSDIFPWSKHFTINAPGSMVIAPMIALTAFGKIVLRQTYVSQSTMRSTAECIGFNHIQWRDSNTPLQP